MTDRAQFEAMLEALINDDQQAAKEIFHNIVVGKSREIYEELLAEDFSRDTGNPYGQNESSEDMEEEESMEEDMDEEEEMEGAKDDADDSEDDSAEDDSDDGEEEPADDADDSEDDPFASDEEGDEADGDIEDRVMDLEDALEDLKAEFEQLLAGEEAEEHDHPGIHDMGGDDAMGDMGMDAEVDELAPMMEYVNKVPAPKHGDNGTNTKSIVAGKNDMGGTTANIAQGHVEVHGDAGTKAGGTAGGLAKNKPADLTAGLGEIHNRPGKTDAGKKGFKKTVAGGGIDRQAGFNKPGKQVGATDSSGKGESNTQSTLRPRK
jgi:hypothetical protein